MRLQTRYYLGNLILFGIYAVIIMTVPTYVITKDIGKLSVRFEAILLQKHRQLVRDQEVLLKDVLEGKIDTLRALLSFAYQTEKIPDQIGSVSQGAFEKGVFFNRFDPEVGFAQLRDESTGAAFTVALEEAQPYHVIFQPLDESISLVLLYHKGDEENEGGKLGFYIGKKIEDTSSYVALIPLGRVYDEIITRFPEIKTIQEDLLEKREIEISSMGSEFLEMQEDPLLWSVKVEMMESLLPLYIPSAVENNEKAIPFEGIARLNSNGSGQALFGEELFYKHGFFLENSFFEQAEKEKKIPIAEPYNMIFSPDLRHVYFGKTLKIGSVYVTVGSGIDKLVQSFARWANQDMILKVYDEVIRAYDSDGKAVPQATIEALKNLDIFSKRSGVFSFEGKIYIYSNVSDFMGKAFDLYQLSEIDADQSTIRLTKALSTELSGKIALQLLLLSLVVIGVVQYFLGRLVVSQVIVPVEKLAKATQLVAQGKYTEVELHETSGRKDEISELNESFREMVQGLKDKEKIRSVLDKVVSKDVAQEILKTNIHLGGEERVVTTFFGDIRGFTSISENLSPHETINLLNSCMTRITHILEKYGGVIDKFVGDEVMALFGAPTTHEDDPVRAVLSAVEILESIKQWNEERKAEGLPEIYMGFGLSSGTVLAGNMGAEDRLNYTVLGSEVNLASRLCSAAPKGQVYISKQTASHPGLKGKVELEELPPLQLKGFSHPIAAYRVVT